MTKEEAIAILIHEKDEDPFMRTEYREQIHEALEMAIKALEQESKTGNWINYKDEHQCDKCREFVFMSPHSWEDDELAYDFCPYCGADMRKEQE